jgi:membrane fusion protein (multidrug efflux system)
MCAMPRRLLVAIIVVGAFCVALIAWSFLAPLIGALFSPGFQRPPVTISVVEASASKWTPSIDAVGTAEAVRGVDIAVEAAGVVKSINFRSNDRAAEGQLLVQIDDSIERAEMIAAQANIRLSESQVERAAALRKRGATSQAAFEEARAQLDVAKSTLARLQAVTEQKAVEAPFAGVLGIPQVVVGEYVPVGKILVTLQDFDRMRVEFTVPEQSAGLLEIGQTTRFGITANELTFSGRISGIDPKVDPQTRLVAIEAQLDNPQGRIVPGQFLRIRVELPEEENIVALPQTAVVPSLYGDYVYLVAPGEPQGSQGEPPTIVRQTFVKTGRRSEDRVEILEGVKAGDVIMAVGQNKVQNGARVAIANAPAKTAAQAGAAP